jgi:hypothetical protein
MVVASINVRSFFTLPLSSRYKGLAISREL